SGNEDSDCVRYGRSGSSREVLVPSPPLQGAGPAGRIRDMGSGPESMERAGGGMACHERNRRSGGSGTADFVSTDGHAEAREESPPLGPERQRRVRGVAENPQIAGRQGGRSAFGAWGGPAQGRGRRPQWRGASRDGRGTVPAADGA